MISPSRSTAAAILVGSAAIVAAGSIALTHLLRKSAPSAADVQEEEEFISPDDVVSIFDALFLHMQQVLAQISQQIQQIQVTRQNSNENFIYVSTVN